LNGVIEPNLLKLLESWPTYGDFSAFKDGGRPPYSISYKRIDTILDEYLMVSISVQNMVEIDRWIC